MGQFLPKEDVYVTVCALPVHVKGLIKAVPDGELILINEYLSDKAKRKALRHELRHLRRGDLYRDAPVEELEK